MKTGFGIDTDDIFSDRYTGPKVFASIGETESLPLKNASNARPRKPWEVRRVIGGAGTGLLVGGWFEIDDTNKYIDVNDGASNHTLTLTTGQYTGSALASEVQTKLNTVIAGWNVQWSSTTGVFTIRNTGGKTLSFLWASGTHGSSGDGANAGKELGILKFPNFSEGDTGQVDTLIGEPRYWTHTWVVYADLSSTKSMGADAAVVMIDPLNDNRGKARVDYEDVKVFVASAPITASPQGNTRAAWTSSASSSATFSAQPPEEQNRVRLATFGYSDMARDLVEAEGGAWCFSWRHWDTMSWRHINLLKAFPIRWDTSTANRTISSMRGHGLIDESPSLGINNYYPVAIEERWVANLDFDQWEASTFRTVLHSVIREGKHTGLLWGLRLDEIGSGTVNGEDEADKGYLLWAALTDYSRDDYSGGGAGYISASLSIEQIR